MGMTERQRGSDLRANLTRAKAQGDGTWPITGHKRLFSAPQCDAHLLRARTDPGIGCFLMPRIAPDVFTDAAFGSLPRGVNAARILARALEPQSE